MSKLTIRAHAGRLKLWFKILKNVNGTSVKVQLGLIFSAIIDTFFCLVCPSRVSSFKVYVSGVVYIKNYNVYFFLRKFSDDILHVLPGMELDVHDLILGLLEENDTFVDVGANVGYYSILASRIVGEKGQVISIEPYPSTAEVLGLNVRINNLRNIRLVPKVAWSKKSTISMHVPTGHYGWATTYGKWRESESCSVEAMPLDAICEEVASVKLLKIDVEGSEYQVLRGARETLKKARYVILEVSRDTDRVMRLLGRASFKIYRLKYPRYVYAKREY